MKACFIGGFVAATLLVSTAFAASPLPAGKPAGTKVASIITDNAPLLLGTGVAIFVIIAATGGFNDDSASSTGTNS